MDRRYARHPALDPFAALAEQFCQLVEDRASYSAEHFLSAVHPLLAQLYAAGLGLPSTDILFDEDQEDGDAEGPNPDRAPDPDGMEHEEWRPLFEALTVKLGEGGYYREIHDPYDPPDSPEVTGSLADDVADIYRDLRTGLRKWRRGESGGALWEWRFNFEAHWGQHTVDALRAIHSLAAWHELSWPRGPAAEQTDDADVRPGISAEETPVRPHAVYS
ncbi:MAG TPA: DUF5063 domain-containing protein [Longimicrobium sp.]|nr:DUF5063 domain-containing protein [Longimicrobium sp.]